MQIPGLIFFVNSDIGSVAQNTIATQLSIDEVMSNTEFNARVVADPNYPIVVHINNLRILVTQPDYQLDTTNREFADIVLFVKQGMATVLDHNFGPPTISMAVQRLNLYNLSGIIKSINFKRFHCRKCKCRCDCNCFKHLPLPLQELLIDPFDPSGVHTANCDNEYNNEDFINRS